VRITNTSDVSLPLAVWLIDDEYDYIKTDNPYISVTTLMKPIRQILLPERIPVEQRQSDVVDYIARAMGSSMHTSIERAWTKNYRRSLALLGYPEGMINRVMINPSDEELDAHPDPIPVYLEQRVLKEFNGWTIGGKFDMVAEGLVQDFKSTSVWSWVHGTRDEDHVVQGSLYKWLNPDKITGDFIRINYIFTDWTKMMLANTPNYPPRKVMHKDIRLWSVEDTEKWVAAKLNQINKHKNSLEKDIPHCTDEELWRSDPVFKYYSDPTKASDPKAKSTKNFPTRREADQYKAEKGKGIVVEKPGEVKACGYCSGYDACTQKNQYFNI
jgi:hypothetical protein